MRTLNDLTFDDIVFSEYGIQVSGEGVYNAPERDVTTYQIPGRNGDLVQDNGRFENITVTYPCNITSEFAEKADAFRKAMKSKTGYCKLVDTYHPDEYRMGMYIEEMEFNADLATKSGTIDISFNCKPQRFLTEEESYTLEKTSSSSAVTYEIADVSGITNNVEFKDYEKIIQFTFDSSAKRTVTAIYSNNVVEPYVYYCANSTSIIENGFYGKSSLLYRNGDVYEFSNGTTSYAYFAIPFDDLVGFAATDTNGNVSAIYINSAVIENKTNYRADSLIKITYSSRGSDSGNFVARIGQSAILATGSFNSTMYIDTDTLNAYTPSVLSDRFVVNRNSCVEIIGDLKLEPGENEIEISDMVSSVEIIPRWWDV